MRPGWPEEWAELLSAINDHGVVRNLARAPWPYTADDAKAFVRRGQESLLPHFFVTIPSAQGAELIGCVGLGRDGDDVQLGYWIARDHWGRGYATEAARAVANLAGALGHRRIAASHFTDNPASGKVLRKVGFQPTGEQRVRYSSGRRGVGLTHEYSLDFEEPGNCDDPLVEMRAA